ncbi:ABC transporter ATP-binding protein [Azospirillum canadense]|uniref:ABC transporter ATP-binding protein n=1 Tax=Azospirillum canadense TaxID=403962 RepID=UPI002226C2D3|nr:ABC transporter ATP-binding protein [Azospirillum canadense]MCW2241654.1 osmoprotectant transport system ATP-binding protein [Azospirillum canadense]
MITLDNLTKIFNTSMGPVTAADRVCMEVAEGEVCVLLGPSGCGKTTTLKMVNRLIEKTSGKILVGGRDTDTIDAVELRRTMGYVIQQIGLFPNMTVEENIGVVPRMLGWDSQRIRKRAVELLEMMALSPAVFLRRYPRELSGGQQQRVGVARALAADPPVLIMDEPFGAIDPINREVIQDEFLKMQQTLRKTILFVSHDIDEAVKMADKIAIFRGGKLEQFDSPDNVLAHPANSFIADFVGGDRTLKRLRLLKVRDVLNADSPSVRADESLDIAVRRMHEHDQGHIVVTDQDGRPTGCVLLADAVGRHGAAGDHARALPSPVRLDADLRGAVSSMFTHDAEWLPCVDEAGIFRGQITQRGITHRLGDTYRAAAHAAAVPADDGRPVAPQHFRGAAE